MLINYDNTVNFDLVKAGEYETVIKDAEIKETQTGLSYLNIQLQIRNDVQQEEQNRVVFYTVYQNKETRTFPERMLNTIAKCVAIPNGTKIESLEHFLKLILHKPLRAKVGIREYNGKESNNVNAIFESKFPNVMHKFKDEEKQNGSQPFGQFGNLTETTEDIPF